MITPDKKNTLLIYMTKQLEIVDSDQFISGEFTTTNIANYDNFIVQNCFFEEPFSEKTLTCFMLQGDDAPKLNPIDSLILKFDLFPEKENPIPLDYFKEFYPLRINKQVGLQDIDMLIINHDISPNNMEKFLILRIGTSIYDIFEIDERSLFIKNDMVKNHLEFVACSPYHKVTNQLDIVPKYNIKSLILFFSIGFGCVMLILFLCHFKFMKDAILNKYKKFKIEDAQTLLDVNDSEEEEEEGEEGKDQQPTEIKKSNSNVENE
jgi:hypothetical protein